jgi:hypothetical protein
MSDVKAFKLPSYINLYELYGSFTFLPRRHQGAKGF